MSPSGKRHLVGPDCGRLILRTSRHGLAASAGHDLTIEVSRWSGEVYAAAAPQASTVDITAELATLRVLTGTGGLKPLSDRDKREIAQTARTLLGTDLMPEARFTSEKIVESAGGATIEGTLTVREVTLPLALDVTEQDGQYRATGEVIQSAYGIKPYTAFMGALKVADKVGIEAEIDLSKSRS